MARTTAMTVEEFVGYWVDFVCTHGRQPLYRELEETTGLSDSSISRYVQRAMDAGYFSVAAGVDCIKKHHRPINVNGLSLSVRKLPF